MAHAAVTASEGTRRINNDVWLKWYNGGQKKVVLSVASLEELEEIMSIADNEMIVTALITDTGLTELEPCIITCLGIGPHETSVIDMCTGHLSLFK